MACAVIYYGDRWGSFASEFQQYGTVVPLIDVEFN